MASVLVDTATPFAATAFGVFLVIEGAPEIVKK
jgi:hypothetical protein